MFPQKERALKATIAMVVKKGRTIGSNDLSLKYLEIKGAPADQKNQYSFVASSKVSKLAVIRNLLKRRGRHIIRKISHNIKTPYVCVFFFKPGAVKLDFESLEKEMLSLLAEARIL